MLRLGKRLFDNNNKPFGILIINYEGEQVANLIRHYQELTGFKSKFIMLNNVGVYVDGTPFDDIARSFMWDGVVPAKSFALENPKIWKKMQSQEFGKYEADEGLYSFLKFDPTKNSGSYGTTKHLGYNKITNNLAHKEGGWTLVSFLAKSEFSSHTIHSVKTSFWYLFTGLVLLVALIILVLRYQREHQALFNQSKFLATHDGLTGLNNRFHLDENIKQMVNKADEEKRTISFYFIDLDGFKGINDRYGHNVGDAILKAVAGRLTHAIRYKRNEVSDIVVRLGGDEFLVIIFDLESEKKQIDFGKKLLHLFDDPIHYDERSFDIGASIGSASYRTHSDDFQEAIKFADRMMYEIKNEGKNGFKIYSPPQ
ncbi:hypothetical protein CYQ88_07125 [Hydrogenovibrio sp. SC-1]|uniref:GGDEF domain-containing protein n=1 Tax=Hydrogenovibrio sp. SC-1 TaxID=2065820 RepID=UPI000C79C794|nr:GGDEF domain-containing protein [Hydrogenovibrio sp. SC-1]PLA74282.1 hypothetical protein CYQ88_07125 [Hydrogenovibrio sp. SC-1]